MLFRIDGVYQTHPIGDFNHQPQATAYSTNPLCPCRQLLLFSTAWVVTGNAICSNTPLDFVYAISFGSAAQPMVERWKTPKLADQPIKSCEAQPHQKTIR